MNLLACIECKTLVCSYNIHSNLLYKFFVILLKRLSKNGPRMMVGGRDLLNSIHACGSNRPGHHCTRSITGASAADEVLVTENSLTPQCPALKLDRRGRFAISIANDQLM